MLLEAAIHEMPTDWTPIREDIESLRIFFWDQEEFLAYDQREPTSKMVFWVEGSYSRAWYLLAVIASQQKRFEDALSSLDCGLQLEDHPELWSERGYVLGQLGRHGESLDGYRRAASVRAWAPPSQIARALRGQGTQLIDLDRLEEAEDVLQRSLELEPNSEVARHELDHLADLRGHCEVENKQIPWFLHSFVNPPADPLTIQLLALVEDLPSIPGPKSVGAENYARIFAAFVKRGWVGFEEEFARVVSRERPEYADIKRDLLREPIFSITAHRNMAEMVLGRKAVNEMFGDMAGNRER